MQWLKPESDGGSPLIHYLVERRERKSARWVKVNRDGAHLDTTLKVSGLTEGNIYQFRVTAINKAGESEASEVSLYVVCRVPTCECTPPPHLCSRLFAPWELQVMVLCVLRYPCCSLHPPHH